MEADSAAVGRYKPRGILRVMRAVGASANGLVGAFREEAAFRQELALATLVIPLGLWLGHSGVERALLIAPMLLVLIVELLNSAIEATVDRIGFERQEESTMVRELRYASLCLLLACAHAATAGDGAPAAPSSAAAPVTPPAA